MRLELRDQVLRGLLLNICLILKNLAGQIMVAFVQMRLLSALISNMNNALDAGHTTARDCKCWFFSIDAGFLLWVLLNHTFHCNCLESELNLVQNQNCFYLVVFAFIFDLRCSINRRFSILYLL